MCGSSVLARLLIDAVAIEAPVDARKDLMGLVDDAEVEWRRSTQHLVPRTAARILAPDEKDARRRDIDISIGDLACADPEERIELVLPLTQECPWHHDQNALLRVPDPQSQAWLLLAQGTRSFHADSLAGPPPSPISDQGKGWIILGILVLVVLGLVFVPKAYD